MIKYYTENESAVIKLNRPEKRNALHPDMVFQIKESLVKAENDANVKSLIITGEGKSFCAGADLEYLQSLMNFSPSDNDKDSQSLAELFLSVYKFSKPTIAAVNGAAIAGGCGLASVCDLIVAHPEYSKFGYSEVKIGFIPAIVSVFLIKRIGESIARQLLLTGDYIDGRRAYEVGFVNYLSEKPEEFAAELAGKLNNNSVLSLRLTKRMTDVISGMTAEDAVGYCTKLNTVSRESDDFSAGLNKFLTKS